MTSQRTLSTTVHLLAGAYGLLVSARLLMLKIYGIHYRWTAIPILIAPVAVVVGGVAAAGASRRWADWVVAGGAAVLVAEGSIAVLGAVFGWGPRAYGYGWRTPLGLQAFRDPGFLQVLGGTILWAVSLSLALRNLALRHYKARPPPPSLADGPGAPRPGA